MEQLPNELWLFIYSYLHNVDILYSFTNLNHRFQQLITPYQYNINLSDVSFKLFKRFLYVLPVCGHNILSFTLKNMHQITLCKEKNILHSMKNLQCLTFTSDCEKDLESKEFWSENFTYLKHLTELRINGSFNIALVNNNIGKFTPSSLTNLTLLSSHGFNYDPGSISIPNIKVLKVHLYNLNGLFAFIHNLHKLEELYLSVAYFTDYTISYSYSIPKSLTKLHFEFGRFEKPLVVAYLMTTDFARLQNFLSKFQHQLQFLTLIVTNSEQEFSDFSQLQLLVKSILHLISFEYLIRTPHSPPDKFAYIEKLPNDTYLVYTARPARPVSFTYQYRNESVNEYLLGKSFQLNELYNLTALSMTYILGRVDFNFDDINYKLPNLRSISYYDSASNIIKPNVINLFSTLLSLSLNLKFLNLGTSSSMVMINLLKHVSHSSTKIDQLKCNFNEPFDLSFINVLAQILPHLKYLYLGTNSIYVCNHNDDLGFCREAVGQIMKSFNSIIYFDLRMYITGNEKEEIYEQMKVYFREQYVNMIFLRIEILWSGLNETVFRFWL